MALAEHLAWGLLLLGACAALPQTLRRPMVQYGIDPDYHSYGIRRIVVMPFDESEDQPGGAATLEAAFLDELHRGHGFEALEADAESLAEIGPFDQHQLGAYRVEALRKLRQRFRADAVLFGTATSYRPYDPVLIGAQVELVSLENGMTLWTADGQIDTAEGAIVRILREDDEEHGSGMKHEWDLKLRSPRAVARYLAQLCLSTLDPRRPQSPAGIARSW